VRIVARAYGEYEPNSFSPSDLATAIEQLAVAWGCSKTDIKFSVSYSYGNCSEDKDISLREAESFTTIADPVERLMAHYYPRPGQHAAHFSRTYSGALSISVTADDMIAAQNLLAVVASALKVTPYEPKEVDSSEDELKTQIGAIEARLRSLEKAVSEAPLRCFLSYRFSQTSSRLAWEVERYLSLLGVEVVSGAGYEPRRVEDKVRDRILSGVDFVIYLVTAEGESSWLRDELATATAAGASPVPLVEEGTDIDKGLLGNIEYIPFAPGHPGDCWIRLAEAVRYVRATRSSS